MTILSNTSTCTNSVETESYSNLHASVIASLFLPAHSPALNSAELVLNAIAQRNNERAEKEELQNRKGMLRLFNGAHHCVFFYYNVGT